MRQPISTRTSRRKGKYADLTVRFSRPQEWETHRDGARLNAQIRKSSRFKPLDYSEFAASCVHFRETKIARDRRFAETLIELDGDVDDAVGVSLQDKIWSHMDSHSHLRPQHLGGFVDAKGKRASQAHGAGPAPDRAAGSY